MTGKKQRGYGGWVPVGRLRPPPGGPASLYRAARLARVRWALGGSLGPHLAAIAEDALGLTLVFSGSGWERALEPLLADLQRAVADALGRPETALRVRSAPGLPAPAPPSAPAEETAPVEDFPVRLQEVIDRCRKAAAGARESALTGRPPEGR